MTLMRFNLPNPLHPVQAECLPLFCRWQIAWPPVIREPPELLEVRQRLICCGRRISGRPSTELVQTLAICRNEQEFEAAAPGHPR